MLPCPAIRATCCSRNPVGSLLVPCATFFAGLFATAAFRDTLRRAALAETFKLSTVPVHAQWDSFVLFAVVFVAGLGVVAYLVKLAYTRPPQT